MKKLHVSFVFILALFGFYSCNLFKKNNMESSKNSEISSSNDIVADENSPAGTFSKQFYAGSLSAVIYDSSSNVYTPYLKSSSLKRSSILPGEALCLLSVVPVGSKDDYELIATTLPSQEKKYTKSDVGKLDGLIPCTSSSVAVKIVVDINNFQVYSYTTNLDSKKLMANYFHVVRTSTADEDFPQWKAHFETISNRKKELLQIALDQLNNIDNQKDVSDKISSLLPEIKRNEESRGVFSQNLYSNHIAWGARKIPLGPDALTSLIDSPIVKVQQAGYYKDYKQAQLTEDKIDHFLGTYYFMGDFSSEDKSLVFMNDCSIIINPYQGYTVRNNIIGNILKNAKTPMPKNSILEIKSGWDITSSTIFTNLDWYGNEDLAKIIYITFNSCDVVVKKNIIYTESLLSDSIDNLHLNGPQNYKVTPNGFIATLQNGKRIAWGNKAQYVFPENITNVEINKYNPSLIFGLNTNKTLNLLGISLGSDDTTKAQKALSSNNPIASIEDMFAGTDSDGNVLTWGINNDLLSEPIPDDLKLRLNKNIYSNLENFAAIKDNGEATAWGKTWYNGAYMSPYVYCDDKNLCKVYDNDYQEDTNLDNLQGIPLKPANNKIYSNLQSFAVIASYPSKASPDKSQNIVVAWGNDLKGGKAPANLVLNTNQTIFSNTESFTVIQDDGRVAGWGGFESGGYNPYINCNDTKCTIYEQNKAPSGISLSPLTLTTYPQIYSTELAYAAITNAGAVVTWGYSNENWPTIDEKIILTKNPKIYSNKGAFAVIKDDGTIFAWGSPHHGSILPHSVSELNNVKNIIPMPEAFIAVTQ